MLVGVLPTTRPKNQSADPYHKSYELHLYAISHYHLAACANQSTFFAPRLGVLGSFARAIIFDGQAHNTKQRNTRQRSAAQHITTQHSTAQHDATRHITTQPNATQHCTSEPFWGTWREVRREVSPSPKKRDLE